MYSQKSKGALRDTSIFFMGEKKNDVSKMMQEKVGGGGVWPLPDTTGLVVMTNFETPLPGSDAFVNTCTYVS